MNCSVSDRIIHILDALGKSKEGPEGQVFNVYILFYSYSIPFSGVDPCGSGFRIDILTVYVRPRPHILHSIFGAFLGTSRWYRYFGYPAIRTPWTALSAGTFRAS